MVRAEDAPGADVRGGLSLPEYRPDLGNPAAAGTRRTRVRDVVQQTRPNKRVYELTDGNYARRSRSDGHRLPDSGLKRAGEYAERGTAGRHDEVRILSHLHHVIIILGSA
jgi:hypothetical protein